MDALTLFVGIIACCTVVLTAVTVGVLIYILKAVRSVDDKVNVITFELSQILPNIRKTTQNIADVTSVFSIFSFFRKPK